MRIHMSIKEQSTSQISSEKRKLLQFSLAILLAGCLLATSVNAQEFNKNSVRAIAKSLPKDLADPFDKFQLASGIKSFFEWRKRISGFALRTELEQKFKDAFAVFVGTLYTKDLRGAENRLKNDLLKKMITAYKKNENDFQNFYTTLQNTSSYYMEKSLVSMRKQIAQFAVVLNESGTDALDMLMQFTGIWPFC